MKKMIIISMLSLVMCACNNENSSKSAPSGSVVQDPEEDAETLPNPGGLDVAKYDPNRGSGKFNTVDVANKLNTAFANDGEKVYDVKCSGCHKVTDEKLIGPGWAGVTVRHKPEWIMNFVTNTDEMLEKDPKAQEQLQICLVRMPDQNLTDKDARDLLEFMRKNDGVK
ncbi:MAG: cytochrome c [Ginsengibacter sp.]